VHIPQRIKRSGRIALVFNGSDKRLMNLFFEETAFTEKKSSSQCSTRLNAVPAQVKISDSVWNASSLAETSLLNFPKITFFYQAVLRRSEMNHLALG
jgi:hypothetical protein